MANPERDWWMIEAPAIFVGMTAFAMGWIAGAAGTARDPGMVAFGIVLCLFLATAFWLGFAIRAVLDGKSLEHGKGE